MCVDKIESKISQIFHWVHSLLGHKEELNLFLFFFTQLFTPIDIRRPQLNNYISKALNFMIFVFKLLFSCELCAS